MDFVFIQAKLLLLLCILFVHSTSYVILGFVCRNCLNIVDLLWPKISENFGL